MKPIILSDLKHSPFSLVTFAYQAGLRSQGVPGWQSLITAHQHQQISSLDLVQKAIEANLLPAQLLSNQEYLNAVDNGLYLYYSKQPESNAVSLINKLRTKLFCLADRILMYSQSKLFLGRSNQRDRSCGDFGQSIAPQQKRQPKQNWQTFDRQLFMLRSRF